MGEHDDNYNDNDDDDDDDDTDDNDECMVKFCLPRRLMWQY